MDAARPRRSRPLGPLAIIGTCVALIGIFVHVVIAQSGVVGRVVDTGGQPLPRARLEIVATFPAQPGADRAGSPTTWREVAYADDEGGFSFVAPRNATWPLTASDSGFRPVTQRVSGSVAEPVVFKLTYTGGSPLSVPEYERFDQGCGCEGNLFSTRNR